jgi:hypothetical protein
MLTSGTSSSGFGVVDMGVEGLCLGSPQVKLARGTLLFIPCDIDTWQASDRYSVLSLYLVVLPKPRTPFAVAAVSAMPMKQAKQVHGLGGQASNDLIGDGS